MKKLLLAFLSGLALLCLIYGLGYCQRLDMSQVPEECKGQKVTCSDLVTGNCFAIHCPGSTTYGSNGEIVSRKEPCNPCSFFRRCSCENGKEFNIQIMKEESDEKEIKSIEPEVSPKVFFNGVTYTPDPSRGDIQHSLGR